jgi:hypothetical protein
MKITKLIQSSLLAMASIAIITVSANAAALTASDTGELFLGFSKSGATNDYVVKIGNYNSLPTTTSSSFYSLSTADLISAFGSTWYTGGTVKFTVFGLDLNTGNGSLALGSPSSTALTLQNAGNVNTIISQMDQLIQGGYATTSSSGVDGNALTIAQSNTNSYTLQGTPSTGWGALGTIDTVVTGSNYLNVQNLGASGAGASTSVKGFFTIASTGVVSYNVAAVPEPTTYASLLVGGLLLALVVRRRSVNA